jgi:hypothetical protein
LEELLASDILIPIKFTPEYWKKQLFISSLDVAKIYLVFVHEK